MSISLQAFDLMRHRGSIDEEAPHETWDRLDLARQDALGRARRAAAIINPTLLPPVGVSPDNCEASPTGTSMMSTLVSGLASRVHDALFPDSVPFVAVKMTKKGIEGLAAQGLLNGSEAEVRATIAESEAAIEAEIMKEWARWGQSAATQTAILHAVTMNGGALLLNDSGDLEALAQDQFCVEISRGRIVTFVVGRAEMVLDIDPKKLEALGIDDVDDHDYLPVVTRYTAKRDGKRIRFEMRQSIDDEELPDEFTKMIDAEDVPFIYVPWRIPPGGNYSVGPVAENMGDIEAMTYMLQASMIYGTLMSEVRFLIDPAAGISPEDFAAMENGDARRGRAEGVQTVQVGDYRVLQSVTQAADMIRQRLGAAFVDTQSVVRNSERTTAYEVQQVIAGLNQTYTAVYEGMAKFLQLPIANMLFKRMKIKVDDSFELSISAGKAALSRAADAARLQSAFALLAASGQIPPNILQALNSQALIKLAFSYNSLQSNSLVLSPEEVQQAAAAQAQAEQGATPQ